MSILNRCSFIDKSNPCSLLKGRNTFFTYPPSSDNGTVRISLQDVQIGFDYIDLVLANQEGDSDCGTALKHIICLVAAPPCNFIPAAESLPVCPDSCIAYSRLLDIAKCDSLFQLDPEQLSPNSTIIAKAMDGFECSNMSRNQYNGSDPILNSQDCTNLFSDEQKGQWY